MPLEDTSGKMRVSISIRERLRRGIPFYAFFIVFAALFLVIIVSVVAFGSAEQNERRDRRQLNATGIISNCTCLAQNNECGETDGRGVCWHDRCVCANGWHGVKCEVRDCETIVLNCSLAEDCSMHGECYFGKCICEPGYSGTQCDFRLSRGRHCSLTEQNCGQFGKCVLSETGAAECYCPINGQDVACLFPVNQQCII
jgi:hypothetical protein